MSYGRPSLSDIELRYPFAPRSRKFFESIPVEEGLASREVVEQAESRLLNALGRAKYEPHMSELIEFSSFFAAALVAGQDAYLTLKFAKKEGERAKGFFVREAGRAKPTLAAECFSLRMDVVDEGGFRMQYSTAFEDYLTVATKYGLTKAPRWKLVRQALQNGVVFMTDNMLNDFFGDCAQMAIAEGVRNLRRAAFPKQLSGLKASVMQYVPVQKARTGKGYAYVEDLLKHPVSDGRHRLVWLVLAPYLVNVRRAEDDEAIERIRGFVSVAGETADMKRFIEYNVRRARRNGLLPPTLTTLKTEHPDLYSLLPKEVLATEALAKTRVSKQSSS